MKKEKELERAGSHVRQLSGKPLHCSVPTADTKLNIFLVNCFLPAKQNEKARTADINRHKLERTVLVSYFRHHNL